MKRLNIFICSLFCILAVTNQAQYTVLYNFTGTIATEPYGSIPVPYCSLTFSRGLLYGMTTYGGANDDGCIFCTDTNGNGYKDLHDFDSLRGKNPHGALTYNLGTFYGMTTYGGEYNYGCIFSMDTNGNNYKDLFDFNDTDGAYPYGSLTVYESKIFGMTFRGGPNSNDGVIFSVDTNGANYKLLEYTFNYNPLSGYPYGSLTLSGKVLYGMAWGSGMFGNIFSIDTDGSGYRNLYQFNSSFAGCSGPYGSLLLSGSKLFGMTSQGKIPDNGNIFSIDTNGNGYKDLFDFTQSGTYGEAPLGSLILSGSTLYGMTPAGGIYHGGTIFSIDTDGNNMKALYDFINYATGTGPTGCLTLSGSTLYGMTNLGGTDSVGVIFKIDTGTIAGINSLTIGRGTINIYPNPNNGLFDITLSNVNAPSQIEIYNVLGEKVYQSILTESTTQINIGNQAEGVYFYRVLTKVGTLIFSGKFVINN